MNVISSCGIDNMKLMIVNHFEDIWSIIMLNDAKKNTETHLQSVAATRVSGWSK